MWTAVAERSGDTAFYCRRVNAFYRRWFFQKRRRRFALPAHSIERSGKLGPALVNVMLCSHQPRPQTINHLKVACEEGASHFLDEDILWGGVPIGARPSGRFNVGSSRTLLGSFARMERITFMRHKMPRSDALARPVRASEYKN